jgi:hypothetical protein
MDETHVVGDGGGPHKLETSVRAVFTTYLVTTCLWVVSRQVEKTKATDLTTMVSNGTETQQKTVSLGLVLIFMRNLQISSQELEVQ